MSCKSDPWRLVSLEVTDGLRRDSGECSRTKKICLHRRTSYINTRSSFLSVAVIKTLRSEAVWWSKGFMCVTPLGNGSSLREGMKQNLKQACSAKETSTAESMEEGWWLPHGKAHTWLVILYILGHGFQGMVLSTVGKQNIPPQTWSQTNMILTIPNCDSLLRWP